DAYVHLEGVAGSEIGDVVAQVGAVDEIGCVHRNPPARALRALPTAGVGHRRAWGQPSMLPVVQEPLLVVGEGPVEEVGAPPERAPQRLAATPPFDAGVVTRPQPLRNGPAPELGGARVLRILEQAVGKRLPLT